MRPQLTPAEAARITPEAVFGPTGTQDETPWSPRPLKRHTAPDYIIGPDTGFPTVQTAINHAIQARPAHRIVIGVQPGHHFGLIYVPPTPFAVTLVGLGRTPTDTVLCENIDAQMPGAEFHTRFANQFENAPTPIAAQVAQIAQHDIITTFNAAVLRVASNAFQLCNITVQNSYQADRDQPQAHRKNAAGQYTTGQHQAVALHIAGADCVQVQDVVLRSYQDTLYLAAPQKGKTSRSHFARCDISGDVDFIFGQSTTWFEGCTIRSLGSRAAQSWATAPSTDLRTPYGFVFNACRFTHDGSPNALRGTFGLGRQWFEGVRATPYGTPTVADYRCTLSDISAYAPPHGTISPETLQSVGKCIVMRCEIGAHINAQHPWDSWNGPDWSPRYRPVQFKAADLLTALSDWHDLTKIDLSDIDPETRFIAEFQNTQIS